jgi:hypothetical protein
VLSNIAVSRLEKLGLRKLIVPLGTSVEEPHTVVLVSEDFQTNKNKLAILVRLIWYVSYGRFRMQMSWGCGLVV